MTYRNDLWEIAAHSNGVVTVAEAEDAGVPGVEVRKLATRGALEALGKGIYLHQDVPHTRLTQPAAAVALAGDGAFLQRESVFSLLGLGHFNPPRINVGTTRRVRRSLPRWVNLETRKDIDETDLTFYRSVRCTTVERALCDMLNRIPPDRWTRLADQAIALDLADANTVNQMDHP